MNTRYLTKAGLIAAIYVVLVALEANFGTLAWGPIQFRVAEALVLLPLIESAAIPGVFVGCLIANILLSFMTPLGLVDIVGGSLVTLVAAYLTSKMPNVFLGMLPPVILNGLIVSLWVAPIMDFPYWMVVLFIGLGELAVVGLLGTTVNYAYQRSRFYQ